MKGRHPLTKFACDSGLCRRREFFLNAARLRVALACLITNGVFLVSLAQLSTHAGFAWDEGLLVQRGLRAASNIDQTLERTLRKLSSPWQFDRLCGRIERTDVDKNWQYTTVIEGHPAGQAWLVWLSTRLTDPLTGQLQDVRFAQQLLMCVSIMCVQWRLTRFHLCSAAIFWPFAIFGFPRLVGHLRFATLDGPLTALWLMCWAIQPRSHAQLFAWSCWGAILGICCSFKATGLGFLPGALLLACLYRARSHRLLAAGVAFVTVFVCLNPSLWTRPNWGIGEFLLRNLHRADRPAFQVATQFWGTLYPTGCNLPWSTAWIRLAVMTPVTFLAALPLGIHGFTRASSRELAPILCHCVVLPIAQAFPSLPSHDDLRLILPSCAMITLVATVGICLTVQRIRSCGLRFLVLAACFGIFWIRTWTTSPFLLSDFNLFIGGPQGAVACGLEPAYYWDGFGPNFVGRLTKRLAPGATVRIAAYPQANIPFLEQLAPQLRWSVGSTNQVADWTIIQNRPAHWSELDARLMNATRIPEDECIKAHFESSPFQSENSSPALLAAFHRTAVIRALEQRFADDQQSVSIPAVLQHDPEHP